jgi:hypothetical protein
MDKKKTGHSLRIQGENKRFWNTALEAYLDSVDKRKRFGWSEESGGRKLFRFMGGKLPGRIEDWVPCDTSGRPRAIKNVKKAGLVLKRKRVSKVTRYCQAHGKFGGYQWSGHRRACVSPELTKEEFRGSAKPLDVKVAKVAKPKDSNGYMTLESVAGKLNSHVSDLESQKAAVVSNMVSLESEIDDLLKKIEVASAARKTLDNQLNELEDKKKDFLCRVDLVLEDK